MRVLVTGGAGYVGSHTAKALANLGHEVVTLDNLTTGHAWAVRWGPLIEGDVRDTEFVNRVLGREQPDAVLHFAGSAYVGESMTAPERYFDNNVIATLRLLEAIIRDGIRPFVFSSSCATYGVPDRLPITEAEPQTPISPYGESKLMVERALRWYGEIHDLPWAALRYFNAAGADLEAEIGEVHDPEPHLIPLAIGAATGANDALRVYGTDYPTRDGSPVRDYIHVFDLAAAHVRALEQLSAGTEIGGLNLGTGQGVTVHEVIDAVEAVTGRNVPAEASPRRLGDPAELVADASRAASVLGWSPRLSDLDTIVASALEFALQHSSRPAELPYA